MGSCGLPRSWREFSATAALPGKFIGDALLAPSAVPTPYAGTRPTRCLRPRHAGALSAWTWSGRRPGCRPLQIGLGLTTGPVVAATSQPPQHGRREVGAPTRHRRLQGPHPRPSGPIVASGALVGRVRAEAADPRSGEGRDAGPHRSGGREHPIDLWVVVAGVRRPLVRLPLSRLLVEHQTVLATAPAFIARNASLMSSRRRAG